MHAGVINFVSSRFCTDACFGKNDNTILKYIYAPLASASLASASLPASSYMYT